MVRAAALATMALALASVARAQETGERPVDQQYIERLARRIEPELDGQAARVQQYVDFYGREAANDSRIFAYDVKAEAQGDHGVRLSGHIEFPEARAGLVAFFKTLGFEPVKNEIETLPDPELGEERYGFVKASNSLTYAEPAEREVVSDCLLGEPVFLLREKDDHYLVHAVDGYLGWIAAEDVQRVDGERFAEYLDGARVYIRSDHATDDGTELPAGGRLKLVSEKDDAIVAELPGGDEVTLPGDVARVHKAPVETIDAICAQAKKLLGTEYLWGGKTSSGVDCSGLVQMSFASAGVRIPRDSNQQVLVGQLTATRWNRAGLRRGDTLYFINPQGRVSHTGLYLGEDQFIQAISPVVTISSFNPDDDNYAERQDVSFAFARRPLE